MSEGITHLIQDPAWWFSTILVAFAVNIVSNLSYDYLKALYASLTIRRLLILCQIIYAVLVFSSSLMIHSDDYYIRNMAPAIGLLIAAVILFDMYVESKYRIIGLVATFAVFCFSVTWSIVSENSIYTVSLLATQFFISVPIGSVITFFTSSVLIMRERRKQLRSRRD